ncbi:riboflavin synthase alpha chain [Candidatus Pelagibacter sp. IMCC9063]|uniref:riboflavin synthase n=1 Tax=Pelagibacter sp. (strain IMCC9063) TaxID=1002672 RepID=UPI000204686D|nr:riboflavin synthase [Candidatus Pelagibacter sp. IMCC9063]AEA81630.1 riboflavin synthase alpha chain [Candidatus Pelagibacter sp. IMCC9063]
MFTGIIKNKGKVLSIVKKDKGYEFKISSNLVFSKKNIGTSISINGACLTLTKFLNKNLFFFISYSTFQITNFKYLKKNSTVNLEKSLKFGDEIAGHFVQGHIDTVGKIISLKKLAKTWTFLIKVESKFSHLLVDKGSITIDGISLTIVKSLKNQFTLVVIPHTLKLTNIISLKTGDVVNVEFDIVIKYLSKINKKK